MSVARVDRRRDARGGGVDARTFVAHCHMCVYKSDTVWEGVLYGLPPSTHLMYGRR